MTSERMIMVPEELVERAFRQLLQPWCAGHERTASELRSLVDPGYAAPVAAGEPVAWMYDTPSNGRQYSDKRLDYYWWSESKGDYVKGTPLYVLPLAAAHGDDAVRKDAERYRLLRRGQKWSVINGIGDELRAKALDSAIDAAMRAQGDGDSRHD